jgi:hypothetical protein
MGLKISQDHLLQAEFALRPGVGEILQLAVHSAGIVDKILERKSRGRRMMEVKGRLYRDIHGRV